MSFVTSNMLGVNFSEVYDPISASTPDVPGLPFAVGTKALATNGQEYIFATASGAITQYMACAIDENFVVGPATNTRAGTATLPAFAQVAFTDGQSGWFALSGAGGLQVLVRDNVATNTQLYTTASAGVLGTDASTGDPLLLVGVRTAEAAASGGGATEIIASFPSFKTPAL